MSIQIPNNKQRQLYQFAVIVAVIQLFFGCSVHSINTYRAKRFYRDGQRLAARKDFNAAVKAFEKSIRLAETSGFEAGVAHNLNELAIIHTTRGEYGKAREKLSAALNSYEKLSLPSEVSKTLNNIALTYVKEHRCRDAVYQYKKLVAHDERTHNRLGQGIAFFNMGRVYETCLNNAEESQRCYERSLTLFTALKEKRFIKIVMPLVEKGHLNDDHE